MAELLFSLRDVPSDEADDVRQLLMDHDIAFYETSLGNWGISAAAIWLYNTADLASARALIETYQQQRAITQRALYLQMKAEGQHSGFWRQNLRQPFRFLSFTVLIAFVAYASIKWLFELGF